MEDWKKIPKSCRKDPDREKEYQFLRMKYNSIREKDPEKGKALKGLKVFKRSL